LPFRESVTPIENRWERDPIILLAPMFFGPVSNSEKKPRVNPQRDVSRAPGQARNSASGL
jgi:hypothetical protein